MCSCWQSVELVAANGCVHDPVEPVCVAVVASAADVAAAQLSTSGELEQCSGVLPSG